MAASLSPHAVLQIELAQKAYAEHPDTAPALITIDIRENYEHQEFPKMVNHTIVQNAEEEAALFVKAPEAAKEEEHAESY